MSEKKESKTTNESKPTPQTKPLERPKTVYQTDSFITALDEEKEIKKNEEQDKQ